MTGFEEIKFQNPGVLIATLPDNVFSELVSFAEKELEHKQVNYILKRSKFNDNSVSGIEDSIAIKAPSSYSDFILEFSKEYSKFYNFQNTNIDPHLVETWLNFQKKYEYRPPHAHMAHLPGYLSFTTYIKIPWDKETEDKYPNHFRATTFRNGRIEFFYNTFSGQQAQRVIDVDKTYEGKTLLWLSTLSHAVYPFYTSDEHRISLAGNVALLNPKKPQFA
jgi:hypothetical protein